MCSSLITIVKTQELDITGQIFTHIEMPEWMNSKSASSWQVSSFLQAVEPAYKLKSHLSISFPRSGSMLNIFKIQSALVAFYLLDWALLECSESLEILPVSQSCIRWWSIYSIAEQIVPFGKQFTCTQRVISNSLHINVVFLLKKGKWMCQKPVLINQALDYEWGPVFVLF